MPTPRTSVSDFAAQLEAALDVSYICNREALAVAAERGLTIGAYNSPIATARTGLTVDEAADIAAADPSLVYVEEVGA